jgi:hypothetical protein
VVELKNSSNIDGGSPLIKGDIHLGYKAGQTIAGLSWHKSEADEVAANSVCGLETILAIETNVPSKS